jgi:hypothetical protein
MTMTGGAANKYVAHCCGYTYQTTNDECDDTYTHR